ncbi:MAG TPA: hypothetical protein VEO01_26435, partial [Pseudonocardiaceae bacterium]|nr:hypothetical protein [Pseudonocardiaceae bacterium]
MPGTTLADAYVRIRSDLSQFAKEVEVSTVSAAEVAGKEAGLAFGAKFSETTKDLLKSAVTTVGILGLGEVVREAVVASDELTHATDALKVAAGDAGVSVDEATGHLKEASTEGEKLGFTNVEVARSYTSLLIKFHDANLATRLLAGSEDYAAFKHIGLAAAADRVGKAAFGSTRALRDMGVAVNSNTSLADRQQLVWQALARVQGQAEEAT